MNGHSRGTSTLLIGVDGANDSILSSLLEAGVLPNFESIFEAGASGPLESQIPPWTPSAWPSMYTGMNPGKHGIFDFLDFDGYDWSVVNATHLRERPIWQHLDHYGLSSVVVNVPVTHPPEPFEGALVPGYTAPENPTCYPEGLLEDLRYRIGEYRIYPDDDGEETSIEEYVDLVGMRGRAFRYLADQFVPEFGFVQFQVTDTVFHDRPGDMEAVREIYQAVDEEIGAILDVYEPDTVIVASDHGLGEYEGYSFRINEYLREEGYVEGKRGGTGMPTWSTVRDTQFKAGNDRTRPKQGVLSRSVALLAKVGLTSQRIARILGAVGLDEVVRRRVPTSVISAGTEQVDFPASRAYARSHIECGVRINLEGREPDGVVPREEYDQVRDELISILSTVETPDGEPVFEEVVPREEYFDGPAASEAVDVVTVPAEFDHFLSTDLAEDVFDDPEEPWNHKRDGLVALAGDAVDSDIALDRSHLFDVAPTVLATFDIPADERMDGSTLPAVESSGERPYPTVGRRERESTNDREVERRLSDLGYLDRDL